AREAAGHLAGMTRAKKDEWLLRSADAIEKHAAKLVSANQKDIEAAASSGLSAAAVDRLRLTPQRLRAAAEGLRQVASLPDPVGQVREGSIRPNGLQVQKISVPLGVIFFLYESRPNVTLDAAALCVKSGNAVILRGGKEAHHSNCALQALLQDTLTECELPRDGVQMVPTLDREAVGHLLKLGDLIDL